MIDDGDVLNGSCNCPVFYKEYVCKHHLGIGIRLKYIEVPHEARDIPIGMKKKRGRASKAKKALIKQ